MKRLSREEFTQRDLYGWTGAMASDCYKKGWHSIRRVLPRLIIIHTAGSLPVNLNNKPTQ